MLLRTSNDYSEIITILSRKAGTLDVRMPRVLARGVLELIVSSIQFDFRLTPQTISSGSLSVVS